MWVNNKNMQNSPRISFSAKPIPYQTAKMLEDRLLHAKTVDIFLHSSPDEDTYNSAKVMYSWLKAQGKTVRICADKKDVKDLYRRILDRFKFKKDEKKISDLALCLDFNGTERITNEQKNFLNAKDIIVIDHHSLTESSLITKNNNEKNYVDNSAKSCCGVLVRFFDALNVKLKRKQLENLYCGMLSDYKKSSLIKIDVEYSKISRQLKLNGDTNSAEVLDKLEGNLSQKSKQKICNHLNVLANLTKAEKEFIKDLPSKIKVTNNGKLAYVEIPYKDKNWAKIGMDNVKTSFILSDLRQNILNAQNCSTFSPLQKEKLKNVEGAIVFYRKNPSQKSEYKLSIHSKNGYAFKLINYIKDNLDKNLIAGGHPDRAGGKIFSNKDEDLNRFVNNFLVASENV